MKHPEQHLSDLQDKHGALFSKSELEIRGGSLEGIHPDLLTNLYEERAFHGFPTFLSSVHRPNDNKSHGRGEAADKILFQNGRYMRDPVSPMAHWTIATTWPWRGVGLYLDWRFQSRDDGKVRRTSGIHTDISTKGSRPLRWIATTFTSDDELASIAQILNRNVETTRRFFYQSHVDGRFYNSVLDVSYTFDQLMSYWQAGLRKDGQ